MLIPEGAVYVYRDANGDLEFRRPDHKAPAGLDVRHLAGIAWPEKGTPASVSMQAHPLTDRDVARALEWAGDNQQPFIAPTLLYPHQQSCFHDIVKHKVATLHSCLGTGGNRILAAAAISRARRARIDRIHVMAGYAAFDCVMQEFEYLQGSGPGITLARVDTAPRLEELAVDGEMVLVLPGTVARNRAGCGPLRVAALTSVIGRGGVVYFHNDTASALHAFPGVPGGYRSQHPSAADIEKVFAS